MSKLIEYPITVKEITYGEARDTLRQERFMGHECGDMVRIRPCAKEHGDKTYLGIMLGDMALSQMAHYNEEAQTIKISKAMYNPAIYVPDLKKVIYGMESWWGKIKSEADLKKITDLDIGNVWYVKAIEQLAEAADAAIDEDDAESDEEASP